MHIPDGLLNTPTCLATSTLAATTLGYAAWRASQKMTRQRAAMMALAGAGVFAAQAMNFPLTAYTSGHMLGAVAAGALLGPWCGMLTVAMVLAVQCLLLGDGGLSALGANTLNMAVLGAVAGHLAMQWSGRSAVSKGAAVAIASFVAVSLGGVACAVEFSASGAFGFGEVISVMMPVHLMLAMAEAVLTAALIAVVMRRGAVLRATPWGPARIVCAMALIAVATLAASPLASQLPDTLEAAMTALEPLRF